MESASLLLQMRLGEDCLNFNANKSTAVEQQPKSAPAREDHLC